MSMAMTLSMPRSAVAALLLEVLGALVVLVFVGSQFKEIAQPPIVTRVTLQSVEAPPTPKTPVPTPPKPVLLHKTSQVEPQPVKQEAPQEPEKSALPAITSPPKLIQQERSAPTPPVTAEVALSFQSRVRAAVQDAVVYPLAARASHFSGRTRVGFTYLDGQASDIRVLVSSGSTLLDQAAILAVKAANYPTSDKEYRGRALSFQLWVRFLLSEDQE